MSPRRRIRGEGAMYQRTSDGRWVGVIDLGWVNGKRVRKSVTAATKKQLTPKFAKLKGQVAAGILPDDATVEQWLNHWLDTVAAERNRPSTMRGYRGYVTNWIVPSVGHLKLDRVRPEHLRALYAHMATKGKSPTTIRNAHTVLRRALEVAAHEGRIPWNPAARMDAPKGEKNKTARLSLAEAKQVLRHLGEQDPHTCARWTVALLAGLRQGEALGLRWEDVDLDAGLIYIHQAAQRVKGKGIVIVPPKSKSSIRNVPMVAPVRYALEQLPSREGFVFGGESPTDQKADWQAWVDMLEDAGVKRYQVRAARATTASLLQDAGVPAKIIAEILGHAQVQVTEEHYLTGDVVSHRKAMAKLDALLLGP